MYDWEKENTVDPSTGILLMPGDHGKNCLGSGEHPDYECCRDECDYYMICFPEWDRPEK